MGEDGSVSRDGTVRGSVLEAESSRSHSGEGRGRSDLDHSLELVVLEEEILGLDPSDGTAKKEQPGQDAFVKKRKERLRDSRSELVGEKFTEDVVGELLSVLGSVPSLLVGGSDELLHSRRSWRGGEEGRNETKVNSEDSTLFPPARETEVKLTSLVEDLLSVLLGNLEGVGLSERQRGEERRDQPS